MGFLGTEAHSLADVSLMVMVTGFLILFSGSLYAKRRDFRKHIRMANVAVYLAVLSFIWMGLSLVSRDLGMISADLTGLLIVSHMITGAAALFGGIFFVLDEIRKSRTPMRVVFLSWTLAMVLGIFLYIELYVP